MQYTKTRTMTLKSILKSQALWRARLRFRSRRHTLWVKRERKYLKENRPVLAKRAHKKRVKWSKLAAEASRMVTKRGRQLKARRVSDRRWGGSRYYTNRAHEVVGGRFARTSRKRPSWHPLSRANPGSDHNMGNAGADASDYATVENHGLKNEISRANGGPNTVADFQTWTTQRGGHTYVHQLIAGTHGTGPHLHYGVHRI